MRWKHYGLVFLDVISIRQGWRAVTTVVGIIAVLGTLTYRLAMSGRWMGAAISFLVMISPFVVAGWLWWRNHQCALEEARQARTPLDLQG